jgi:LuxR family maltose regulon positive regulatory protein
MIKFTTENDGKETSVDLRSNDRNPGSIHEAAAEADFVRWQMPPTIEPSELCALPSSISMRLHGGAPIVFFHAPAGFGKTFAMVGEFERLRKTNCKVAWIAGEALAVSGLGEEAAVDAVRTVAQNADVLFIDDADQINPKVVEAVLTMMEYSSPPKRLVIGARKIQDIGLSRHIARGVTEFITGDLLAWPPKLLSERWHRHLSEAQIRSVYKLTQGWPAPTQLLSRWMSNGGAIDDGDGYVRASHLTNYIDHEVLSQFTKSERAALAMCSLPNEFDQELLDALSNHKLVIENEISTFLLDLVSRGSGPGLLIYNPLLRRHLGDLFKRFPRTEQIRVLRLVSDWAADRGDVVAAANLASMAGDERRIVKYIIQAGGLSLWMTKGYDDIRALVEVAGEALVRSEPRLQLLHCVVLTKDGRIGEADRVFREATKNSPVDAAMERDAAFTEATLLMYGCRAATSRDVQLFNRLSELCQDSTLKTFLPSIQAIRYSQQADFGAAKAAIVEGLDHARAAGSSYPILFLDFHAAGVALAEGALAAAAKILSRARRRWHSDFADDYGAETVLSVLSAQLDFERGRTRQAARHIRQSAQRLPNSEAWLDVYVAGFEPMMRLLGEEQGIATATAAIERSRRQLRAQSLERIADLLTNLRACIEGEAWLFDQNLQPGRLKAADLPRSTGGLATWQERELESLAAAYQALIAENPATAQHELNDLISYARDRGLRRTLQRALLLRTAAHDRAGVSATAQRDFDEAIAIARSTGLRRAFREFGGPSVSDRLTALQAGADQSAGDTFLKSLSSCRHAPSNTARHNLTKRENQVLEQLVVGGSDKTIARRLDVTEHAVRFHLKNIYVKLGVHDRAGAVTAFPSPR